MQRMAGREWCTVFLFLGEGTAQGPSPGDASVPLRPLLPRREVATPRLANSLATSY